MPETLNTTRILIPALAWALWCLVHSLLITAVARRSISRLLGLSRPGYQRFFSLIALITLCGPVWLTWRAGGVLPVFWPWPWLIIQAFLLGAGWGLMLWAGSSFRKKGVDILGMGKGGKGGAKDSLLVREGPYAICRHPMYLAGIILVWSRNLSLTDFLVSLVLSLYLLYGALIEDHRLTRRYGAAYQAYKAKAPLLIPGLKRRSSKAAARKGG